MITIGALPHGRHLARRDFLEVAHPEHRAVRDIVAAGDPAPAVEAIENHLVAPATGC